MAEEALATSNAVARARARAQLRQCRSCAVLRCELAAVYSELDHAAVVVIAERRRADEAEAMLAAVVPSAAAAAVGRGEMVGGGDLLGSGSGSVSGPYLRDDPRGGGVRIGADSGVYDRDRRSSAGMMEEPIPGVTAADPRAVGGADPAVLAYADRRDAMVSMQSSVRNGAVAAARTMTGRHPAPTQPRPAVADGAADPAFLAYMDRRDAMTSIQASLPSGASAARTVTGRHPATSQQHRPAAGRGDPAVLAYAERRDAMMSLPSAFGTGTAVEAAATTTMTGRHPAPPQRRPAASDDADVLRRLEGGARILAGPLSVPVLAHRGAAAAAAADRARSVPALAHRGATGAGRTRASVPSLAHRGAAAATERPPGTLAPAPVTTSSAPAAASGFSSTVSGRNQDKPSQQATASSSLDASGSSGVSLKPGTSSSEMEARKRGEVVGKGVRKDEAATGRYYDGLEKKPGPEPQPRVGDRQEIEPAPADEEGIPGGEHKTPMKEGAVLEEDAAGRASSERKRKAEDGGAEEGADSGRAFVSPAADPAPAPNLDSAEKEVFPDPGNSAGAGSGTGAGAVSGGNNNSRKYYANRGDPRMNRALAAKLEDPSVSLLDALLDGGFSFPVHRGGDGGGGGGFTFGRGGVGTGVNDKKILDGEGVSLYQRKNQLNRRLRRFRAEQAGKGNGGKKKVKREARAKADKVADVDPSAVDGKGDEAQKDESCGKIE